MAASPCTGRRNVSLNASVTNAHFLAIGRPRWDPGALSAVAEAYGRKANHRGSSIITPENRPCLACVN